MLTRQTPLVNLDCGGRAHEKWLNIDFKGDGKVILAHDLRKGIPLENNSVNVVYCSHCLEHFSPQGGNDFSKEGRRVLKPGGILRLVVPDLEQIAREYIKSIDDCDTGNDLDARARHHWMVIEMLDQLCRHTSGGEMAQYWAQPEIPVEEFIVSRMGSEYLSAREFLRTADVPSEYSQCSPSYPTPEETGIFRCSGEPHLWMYDRISLRNTLENLGFCNIHNCDALTSNIPLWTTYNLDADNKGYPHKPDSLYMECNKSYEK